MIFGVICGMSDADEEWQRAAVVFDPLILTKKYTRPGFWRSATGGQKYVRNCKIFLFRCDQGG